MTLSAEHWWLAKTKGVTTHPTNIDSVTPYTKAGWEDGVLDRTAGLRPVWETRWWNHHFRLFMLCMHTFDSFIFYLIIYWFEYFKLLTVIKLFNSYWSDLKSALTSFPSKAETHASDASQMAVRSWPPSRASTTRPPASPISCLVKYPKPANGERENASEG